MSTPFSGDQAIPPEATVAASGTGLGQAANRPT